MKLNVIRGGGPDLFNAILFPDSTPETKQWVYEQFNRPTEMLTELGQSFMAKASDLYQKLNDPSLTRLARRAVRGLSHLGHVNMIRPLLTVGDIQKAAPVMQRYIMTLPELRKLYHQQRCDGYSDTYVDHEPGKIGEEHYDWRRLMNGIVVDVKNENGEGERWHAFFYVEDLEHGDRELDFDEQCIILDIHDIARGALLEKIDPTDIFNGSLE